MTPQVSIITPSLNQGAFLPDALASVAAQRDVALEHLVFDPGSWDGSRATLREWAGAAPFRRAFLERDAGPAHALNRGVAAAQGDIIGWLSSDDLYASPEAIAAVAGAFAVNPDCDIVYGRGALIDEKGVPIEMGPFQLDTSKLGETLRAGEPFLQPAAFVRRRLLDRLGPFRRDFGLGFDVEFWLRAVRAGARFFALDVHVARKRVHRDSASNLLPGVRAMDCARAVRRHTGRAGHAWIARAIKADVSRVGAAAALAAGAAQRRLDREGVDTERLVVLGNGPSLAGFDFDQLRGTDAIGMNAAYRHWRRIGWHPRYYACLDLVVGLSHRDEIQNMVANAAELGIDAFLLRDNLIETFEPAVRRSSRVISFDELAEPGGLLDVSPITTGSHAALFGALLGYRKFILLGIDCNYVERIEGAEAREGIELEVVQTPSQNPNYYFPDYQKAGDRYNLPNPVPDLHIECWRSVGTRLEMRGATIYNASRTSRLDAFPRCHFSELMTNAAAEDELC